MPAPTLVYAAAVAARAAPRQIPCNNPSSALAKHKRRLLIMQERLVRRPPMNAPAGSPQCRAHPGNFTAWHKTSKCRASVRGPRTGGKPDNVDVQAPDCWACTDATGKVATWAARGAMRSCAAGIPAAAAPLQVQIAALQNAGKAVGSHVQAMPLTKLLASIEQGPCGLPAQ